MFVIEKMLQKGSYGMLITLLQGKPIRLAEEELGMSGKKLKWLVKRIKGPIESNLRDGKIEIWNQNLRIFSINLGKSQKINHLPVCDLKNLLLMQSHSLPPTPLVQIIHLKIRKILSDWTERRGRGRDFGPGLSLFFK